MKKIRIGAIVLVGTLLSGCAGPAIDRVAPTATADSTLYPTSASPVEPLPSSSTPAPSASAAIIEPSGYEPPGRVLENCAAFATEAQMSAYFGTTLRARRPYTDGEAISDPEVSVVLSDGGIECLWSSHKGDVSLTIVPAADVPQVPAQSCGVYASGERMNQPDGLCLVDRVANGFRLSATVQCASKARPRTVAAAISARFDEIAYRLKSTLPSAGSWPKIACSKLDVRDSTGRRLRFKHDIEGTDASMTALELAVWTRDTGASCFADLVAKSSGGSPPFIDVGINPGSAYLFDPAISKYDMHEISVPGFDRALRSSDGYLSVLLRDSNYMQVSSGSTADSDTAYELDIAKRVADYLDAHR